MQNQLFYMRINVVHLLSLVERSEVYRKNCEANLSEKKVAQIRATFFFSIYLILKLCGDTKKDKVKLKSML